MPRGRFLHRIAAAAIAIFVIGCGAGGEPDRSAGRAHSLTANVRDSAGVRVVQLGRTLQEVASGRVRVTVVEPELVVGETEDTWIGAAADVASLGRGRFAVLDRMEKQIVVFDSAGRPVSRLGREGGAPGEYRAPLALAAVGDRLVVWQDRPTSTFTVLEPNGTVLATGSAEVAGDWGRARYRDPGLRMRGPRDRQGPEDLTRRLAAFGDSGFVHLLQVNELEYGDREVAFSWASPPAYLIRYGLDARVHDTIAAVAGAATLRYQITGMVRSRGQTVPLVRWKQPLFSGRPVWATGDGWIALGHGDSSRLVVRRMNGDALMVVTWPPSRPAVGEADRLEAATWTIVYRLFDHQDAMEFFGDESVAGWRAGVAHDAEHYLSFAERAPTITAAYAAGSCLFLAGFDPSDWVDGTALTWVVLDVRRAGVEAVVRMSPREMVLRGRNVRVRRHGAAVREFDGRFAFTVSRNEDGVFIVERFRLPRLNCWSAPSSSSGPAIR